MDHSEEQNDLGELLMTNFKIIIIEALWKKEWLDFFNWNAHTIMQLKVVQ